MPNLPPKLPQEVLRRVIRIAKGSGGTVLAISGVLAVASLMYGDYWGGFAGLVIAGAGALEFLGADKLKKGDPAGVRLLVLSQVYLLTAILSYILWKLSPAQQSSIDSLVREVLKQEQMRQALENSGETAEGMAGLMKVMFRGGLVLVAVLSILHQGGMALYYLRRKRPILLALGAEGPTSEKANHVGG